MAEFSFASAHRTPTSYSEDLVTPFRDIGMGDFSDEQIGHFFEGKNVIDIGSGFEGIARRLFKIFRDSKLAPTVINLNPQFTDWRMQDIHKDGVTKGIKRSKQQDIEATIKEVMEIDGEDFDGYMAGRIAVAGIVQNLEFEDDYFNVQVSTWAFPNVLYDCGGSTDYGVMGYQEIMRTQNGSDGIALLAPVREWQKADVQDMLQHTGLPYQLSFKPATENGDVMELIAA